MLNRRCHRLFSALATTTAGKATCQATAPIRAATAQRTWLVATAACVLVIAPATLAQRPDPGPNSSVPVATSRKHRLAMTRLDRNTAGLFAAVKLVHLASMAVLPDWYYQAKALLGTGAFVLHAAPTAMKATVGGALWSLASTAGDYALLKARLTQDLPSNTEPTNPQRLLATTWVEQAQAALPWQTHVMPWLHQFHPFKRNLTQIVEDSLAVQPANDKTAFSSRKALRWLFSNTPERKAAKAVAQLEHESLQQTMLNQHSGANEAAGLLRTHADLTFMSRLGGTWALGTSALRFTGMALFWFAPFHWYFTYLVANRVVMTSAYTALALRRTLQHHHMRTAQAVTPSSSPSSEFRPWAERAANALAWIQGADSAAQHEHQQRNNQFLVDLADGSLEHWAKTLLTPQASASMGSEQSRWRWWDWLSAMTFGMTAGQIKTELEQWRQHGFNPFSRATSTSRL